MVDEPKQPQTTLPPVTAGARPSISHEQLLQQQREQYQRDLKSWETMRQRPGSTPLPPHIPQELLQEMGKQRDLEEAAKAPPPQTYPPITLIPRPGTAEALRDPEAARAHAISGHRGIDPSQPGGTFPPVTPPPPEYFEALAKQKAAEIQAPKSTPAPFKYENTTAVVNGHLTDAAANAAMAKAGQLVDNAAKAGVPKAQGDTVELQWNVAVKIAKGLENKAFLDDATDKAAAQTGLPRLPKGPRSVE